MVDVYMGDYQRTNVADWKINGKVRRTGAVTFFLALEKAAIDKNARAASNGLPSFAPKPLP